MNTCHALFVFEGRTDVPLVRVWLTRIYGAVEDKENPLVLHFPRRTERPVERSKFLVQKRIVGLLRPGGGDEAERALSALVREFCRGLYPILCHLILVRDLNSERADQRHRDFLMRMGNLARSEKMTFSELQAQPAWGQLGDLKVSQALLGDPAFGSYHKHAIEDHILGFLKEQPTRDPSELVRVVEGHLGSGLNPKQQVLLSMLLEDYWGDPAGFYERVLSDVPLEGLRALADSVGLTQVMEALAA